MSNAEDYIEDSIMNISNEVLNLDMNSNKIIYQPWLTPNQARKAVEIAREEIYKWLNEKLPIYIDYRCKGVGKSVEEFVNDLKISNER